MFRQFRKIEIGEFIVVGADTAAGGDDYSACHFLSKSKIDVPLVYHSSKMATEMTSAIFPVLEKIHDITRVKPTVAYERNNGGVFELERLAAMNRMSKYVLFKMPSVGRENAPESVRYGWDTNTATRPAMLSQLKEAVDRKVLKIYDLPTVEELLSFVVMKTSSSWKAQADVGAHDDLVMSLAIAWQLYQMCEPVYSGGEGALPDDTKLFREGGFY